MENSLWFMVESIFCIFLFRIGLILILITMDGDNGCVIYTVLLLE